MANGFKGRTVLLTGATGEGVSTAGVDLAVGACGACLADAHVREGSVVSRRFRGLDRLGTALPGVSRHQEGGVSLSESSSLSRGMPS